MNAAMSAELETLWLDYNKRITKFIANRVLDRDSLDDLVSSVFLRACVATTNGNGCTESASGWLYQIARSVIWDYRRGMRRTYAVVALDDCEEHADHYPQPEEAIEQKMQGEYVRRMVAQLPEQQATVATWRLCGYEFEEIAVGLGKSCDATKQLHTRAYANLRRDIQKDTA